MVLALSVSDILCFLQVSELAPLRSLLECLKEPSLRVSFPVASLCEFSAQIAAGMSYLESKRLIHRDLAARNVLVFSKDKVIILLTIETILLKSPKYTTEHYTGSALDSNISYSIFLRAKFKIMMS